MTYGEIERMFCDKYNTEPGDSEGLTDYEDYRPVNNYEVKDRPGITLYLRNGDIIHYFPVEGELKLKPCPFCGRMAMYFDVQTDDGCGGTYHEHEVSCKWCNISMTGDSKKDVVEKWNKRES